MREKVPVETLARRLSEAQGSWSAGPRKFSHNDAAPVIYAEMLGIVLQIQYTKIELVEN
jgi:hypothetical protein